MPEFKVESFFVESKHLIKLVQLALKQSWNLKQRHGLLRVSSPIDNMEFQFHELIQKVGALSILGKNVRGNTRSQSKAMTKKHIFGDWGKGINNFEICFLGIECCGREKKKNPKRNDPQDAPFKIFAI